MGSPGRKQDADARPEFHKSQSLPNSVKKSWLTTKLNGLFKFISSVDPSSRDRALHEDDKRLNNDATQTVVHVSEKEPQKPTHQSCTDKEAASTVTGTPSRNQHVDKSTSIGRNFRTFIHSLGRNREQLKQQPKTIRSGSLQVKRADAQDTRVILAAHVAEASRNKVINISRNVALLNMPLDTQQLKRDTNILAMCDDLPPGMKRPVWCIGDYTHLEKVHEGYASSVYRALCRLSKRKVVLKIYHPDLLHEISRYQLLREARLHVTLMHPNIIRMYAAFKQADGVVLVQEYADGGDLLQLLVRSGARLSERTTVQLVVKPLLKALYYLHSKSIVHRQLENILFTGPDLTLKLADFGLCLNVREERSVTRAGTLDYMAPEILRCPTKELPLDNKDRTDLAYTVSVDIWALGVMTYELLNGVPPFTRQLREETELLIMRAGQPMFLVHASDMAKEFVYSCLVRKSHQRSSAWQLLRFPWIKVVNRPPSTQISSSGTDSMRSSRPSQRVEASASLIRSTTLSARATPTRSLVASKTHMSMIERPETSGVEPTGGDGYEEILPVHREIVEIQEVDRDGSNRHMAEQQRVQASQRLQSWADKDVRGEGIPAVPCRDDMLRPSGSITSVDGEVHDEWGVVTERRALRASGVRRLERSISELSRHTTEAGHTSNARSRMTDASSMDGEDEEEDEGHIPGSVPQDL
ncbi:hypothetical protein CEUSTIGMA_g7513.t1 [Chlamydomonas eustigma]|uniref:Protein kinase domain-containing protein n=1 Tax=Chlamydomonas eustigma TaxID=1157962 RepID=A0A250XAE6_9CHLO|nr:hypothetical protein CEUSTIGMA_g7513.t1 [Chlamydomonas eustigma]|eukprot:GAX80075.1 hypothetical protein CEUSTIGMA_g7513.t1 [Chlamydomonas eustigma]